MIGISTSAFVVYLHSVTAGYHSESEDLDICDLLWRYSSGGKGFPQLLLLCLGWVFGLRTVTI